MFVENYRRENAESLILPICGFNPLSGMTIGSTHNPSSTRSLASVS